MKPIPKLKYDGSITIATGRNRKETHWKNKEMLWSDFTKRLSQTTRTGETYSEYKKFSKSQQDQIKDVGGFVGGSLKGGRRKTEAVAWRQLLTLDADFVKGDLWSSVEMMFDFACLAYSTHKHHPENPRLRLVIPLSRPITPDEYQAVSRRIAADIGIDFFDDTTYQPHRLMYWPSTSQDGEYEFQYQDEPWLDPDTVLARYTDWTDPSYWPESSRVQQARQKMADKQGDPHEKPGMVGAFCRTYSITEAIETFLEDVYEPADNGRYTFLGGSTTGGLILYDHEKFAFSHHGTDPISGHLVNAFDLIRIHKFGLQDDEAEPGTPVVKLPSYTAMMEFSSKDKRVKKVLGEERVASIHEDFEVEKDWLEELEYNKNGTKLLSTRENILLILENDPNLAGKIAINEFSHRAVIKEKLPWANTSANSPWSDQDDSALKHYLEKIYEINSPTKVHDSFQVLLKKHRFHPVRDYLEGLVWDGVPRLDTVFIDYLGADDTKYTRAVTRKSLTAAVARIMVPGIKFDYMLTMVGTQGLGKSYILTKLGQGWFSDSLTTVQGKEAYEQLQGVWLMEMGELSAARKADVEAIKHFLSKQEDIYRVAYGRQLSVFPRQCVFFGTTNDREFLKDRTGNRRFWPITVGIHPRKKSIWSDLSQQEIDQIWAEAVEVWKGKEPLHLSGELEVEAQMVQAAHTEESPLFGPVQEYLNKLLPEDWNERDVGSRRMFLSGDFGENVGTVKRDKICALEVWVEMLGGDLKRFPAMDRREINDILRRMPGWESYNGGAALRFGDIYGRQRAYVRVEE
ncbi:MAG: hypothetical protein K0S25_28 [Bacillus sp. (in: firmicutes)]|jgi:predicted P-loop ATPase|nr:hypothetical protein [Bacillus sp. (in: firmicutes)]